MCGIVGILGEKASKASLDLMLNKQSHRGPDHTGRYVDAEIALGHNRLSIIDLSMVFTKIQNFEGWLCLLLSLITLVVNRKKIVAAVSGKKRRGMIDGE